MFRFRKQLLPLLFLLLTLPAAALAEKGMAVDPMECLGCHGDKISAEKFGTSPHGRNGCTSCHPEGADLLRHMTGRVKLEKVQCGRCHQQEHAEHAGSVHEAKGIGCAGCHADIHAVTGWRQDKRVVLRKCIGCHPQQREFLGSVHGRAVLAGSRDAADCSDCHGLHAVRKVQSPATNEGRMFHTSACIRCHADEEMMARNNVSHTAVETYLESYHGKGYRLGFPERAAGCSDCHTAHLVLPGEEPASTINRSNVVKVCTPCHSAATPLFARYYAHGSHADRENYPILYWTYIAMTGLLVGTFAVFWVHTLLWMFRGFVENREKQAALTEGRLHHVAEGGKLYYRFQKRHIFLHFTVIISFLGLSLTGLPLKFSDQLWAKTLMSFYGGVHYAGLIHRGCAILTFYYFLGALLMSVDFLFIRKDIRGNFLQRMFGPDSLMPNLRDARDVAGMVRWFLFKGKKPTFERWTYWEKFDFIAVFWGMFAIGGSGLMLWFPELFGRFLPGWMMNVATIIHSDEALLATGFIFTVHFFNTHGRPEKFPMDFVIFNGQMTREEFIEERGDQWQRYEELGITERFSVARPSGVLYDFLFKGFGFAALFTGLTLVFFMLYAFFS
ncbi:MAG: cytochrome c3 family protein [Geobacteraceae bacterium]|nr:cytochrome c3 family protein [Geobacteraceae bacterium]